MELTAQMVDQKGKSSGEAKLSAGLFGAKLKNHLLHDAVLMQLASRRQGSAKTKTRSEIRGGGKKPYRQKGTGNARQGSNRSPLMVGGARLFGPMPRDYSYRLPQKVRRQALAVALSEKQRDGKIVVLADTSFKTPKTKIMLDLMQQLKAKSALVVDMDNDKLYRSVRNLANARYIDVRGLNVFDVMKYDTLLLSSASLKWMEKERTS
ncbi:MAG TPA: 50S ribosomal protein L4 [Bdellovibrionota bacterium]|nr:50S ribosomal protein L4 [Bdellovibrionota bacterium]